MIEVCVEHGEGLTVAGTERAFAKTFGGVARRHNLRWSARQGVWFLPGSRVTPTAQLLEKATAVVGDIRALDLAVELRPPTAPPRRTFRALVPDELR